MHKALKHLIFIFLSFLVFPELFAQIDSSVRVQDSLQKAFLVTQSTQLQELEKARKADSIKRVELEKQISQLKSTDNLKKDELINQLNQIQVEDSLRLVRQKQRIDSLKSFVVGYPVAPFIDDTLFLVYNKLGSFSAAERADAITRRISKLADDYFFKADSLKLVVSEHTVDIVYGENIIMGVSDMDALWNDDTRYNMASKLKDQIAKAVKDYKEATNLQSILNDIALAALVISVLLALIYFINKLFRKLKYKIVKEKGKRLKGIKIGQYQLFDPGKEINFLIFVLKIFKWVIIILAIYLSLPLLFSIFPWTKGYANTLIESFVSPVKRILSAVWDYIPNLVTIIVIIIFFRFVIKGLFFLKTEIEREKLKIPGFYPDWANPTFQIVRVLIYAFMLIAIFPYMPRSDSDIFKGVSVFIGVLFTFGSAGALSNVVAGTILTYMRAFKIGDRVKIGEVSGDIIEKSLLVTRIRTIKNEIISVPNSTVMSSHTINFSSDSEERGLILHTTVTIGYDVPWRQVHQLLIDSALQTDMVEKEPAPFVLQTSLDDFYVSYQVNAYTKEPNKQAVIYSQLHQLIQDKFNEAGVEIMSPHYRAARDGNQSTIPADYLPKDYVAPSFRVEKPGKEIKPQGNTEGENSV